MFRLIICAFLILAHSEIFVLSEGELTIEKFETDLKNDFEIVGKLETVTQGEKEHFVPDDTDCKCGERAKSCDYKDGLKVCTCEDGFVPGNSENCTAMCNDTHKCQNGGTCYNSICLCPPRTGGDFCEKISVKCQNYNYDVKDKYRNLMCCCPGFDSNSTAKCKYDIEKHDAYCECPNKGDVYDGDEYKCKACDCGKPNTWTKCEFISSVKICSCIQHYEYNPKTQMCEPNYCGEGSKKSEFSWSGEIKCTCFDGYQQWKGKCVKCDCGSKGFCELRDGKPICHCKGDYLHPIEAQEFNGKCLDCDCGKHGECVYDKDFKKVKCECYKGFVEENGVCKYCYCGDLGSCSFDSIGSKVCNCSSGTEDVNGFCADIDECQDPNVCPPNEKCVNLHGNFACTCKDGYMKSNQGCVDINECLTKYICGDDDKECINTPGSYECTCKSGLFTLGGPKNSLKCESNIALKVGYGILSVLFGIVVIVLGVILYKIYRT